MENILTAMARQFLPQMEPEERAEALRSLKRMIDEEFFAMAVAESGDETARYMECPRCGSHADRSSHAGATLCISRGGLREGGHRNGADHDEQEAEGSLAG